VREILRISADVGGTMVPLVARDDSRRFVRVALPADMRDPAGDADNATADNEGEPLWRGLYLSARAAGLGEEQAVELIRLFASDFDLEQGATPRDSLSLLQMDGTEDREGGSGLDEVLSAELTVAGQTRRYYRDPDGRSGDLGFVDAEGRSFRTELDKKPVANARLTSRFGGRYHPILHYSRPHNGIDWAARIGTPVLAAGDGEVIDSGVRSGFGRHIEIRHAEGFVTTYSHLDRIGAGITAGKRVQRGDVIGTLGQSGLATGPHLHFEFKLNGVYVDPLAIRIPRPHLAETGPRFAAWVSQINRLSHCESCEALH
jgi:murein DD-endopeptidase MepM/ murein hydrolase activator NlpD